MAETALDQPHEDPTPTPTPPETVFADVLCAVDGSKASYEAVRQAAALAGCHGRLTLLAVTAVSGSGPTEVAAISPTRAADALALAEQIARKAGVPATRVVDPGGPPAKVVVERAARHDLLAMGAPSSSWIGALLVGGVTEMALRSLTTPLLMARRGPSSTPFPKRIVLASDGGDDSDALVELGARLARAHEGGAILVHAVGVESQSRPHRIEAQARALERALPEAFEVHIEPTGAFDAIVERANGAGASLIVMGWRRREGLRALGSVSARMVHEAPCSVLLVPPPQTDA
ncbi:MAG TPA: universal stress protein [Solirubrobacteraceae bacterium]|nr:universal stress protein [Solirubrobacteraceae bacterium]